MNPTISGLGFGFLYPSSKSWSLNPEVLSLRAKATIGHEERTVA